MPSEYTNRIDYIEAVRVFALVLGIIFHASLSFIPIFIGWAVMDISTSSLVPIFALVSHSFRMELFFLIAGIFSCIKYHQLGTTTFLKSRLVRIGIPFLIGWFVLRPLLVSGWTLGADSMQGDVDYYGALLSAVDITTQISDSLFVGTHLWFLYYLLLSTVCVVIVRHLVRSNTFIYKLVRQFLSTIMAFLSSSKWGLLLLAMPTAVCVWFMAHWGVDTPDKSMIPHPSVFILYTYFFGFGWLLQRQPSYLEALSRLDWSHIVIALVSIIVTTHLLDYQMRFSDPYYLLIKIGFTLSYSLMMWSLVFITMGIFKLLVTRSNKVISYLADASYWLYLIHLPIVIYLQVAFAELSLPWFFKLICICIITLTLSLLMYAAFVRSTFIGKWLNGKRKPRLVN